MKNSKFPYILLLSLTTLAALLGIFLPGILLHLSGSSKLNQTAKVPTEYYSGTSSAVARNSSSQLSEFQKIQLISGAWDSEDSAANSSDSLITEYEAVALAQAGLDKLCEANLYPSSIQSNYGNWYSWSTEFYKATDTTFHTYTSYYWVIHFVRYDEAEQHTVLMTEDGNILFAMAEIPGTRFAPKNITTGYTALYDVGRTEASVISPSSDFRNKREDLISAYPHVDSQNLTCYKSALLAVGRDSIDTEQKFLEYYQENSSDDLEFYYLFQCSGTDCYAVGLVPYTE